MGRVPLQCYLSNVFAVSLLYFWYTSVCVFLDCFYQFLGLAADSYQFYVACKFRLGTGLMKTLQPCCFPVAITVEGLFSMYTYTRVQWRGGKKNPELQGFQAVSYLPCVVLNASQQITVTCLYSIHYSSGSFSPLLVSSKIWFLLLLALFSISLSGFGTWLDQIVLNVWSAASRDYLVCR